MLDNLACDHCLAFAMRLFCVGPSMGTGMGDSAISGDLGPL